MSKTKLEFKENDRGLNLNIVCLINREEESASSDGDITIQGVNPFELAMCCKIVLEHIIEGAFNNEEDRDKMRVLVKNIIDYKEEEDDKE